MSINFIVNDPLATASVPMRSKDPLPNRPAAQAGFNFVPAAAAAPFQPGTPDFLFWQSREAALAAVQMWESLNGPLKEWGPEAANPKALDLLPDADDDLNAFYDRRSLSFFHHQVGPVVFFSGASTDVVSHESGHAFLDTLRPELFGTNVTEHGAFHEAFGDCTALLTALSDRETRQALLAASPDLASVNFVESLAEQLSDAVKQALGPNHPAAEPRHALNNFTFQLPTTLPRTGPPAVLTSEIHSFGRVFVGCFYDTIRNLFSKSANRDEATLFSVAQIAGKLLIAGAQDAIVANRFFQAVGRAIVLADGRTNSGANQQAISDAFAAHGVPVGAGAAVMPEASLMGPAPQMKVGKKGATVSPLTLQDIRKRLEAPKRAQFSMRARTVGGEPVIEATHQREVRLDKHAKELKGVVAYAPEPVLIGGVGKAAALFGSVPDPSTTEDEVHAFVETLVENAQISFSAKKSRPRAGIVQLASRELKYPTHMISTRAGKKVLTRVRYACRAIALGRQCDAG